MQQDPWDALALFSNAPLLATPGAAARGLLRACEEKPELSGVSRSQWSQALANDDAVMRANAPFHFSTSCVVFSEADGKEECKEWGDDSEREALLLWHLKAREWVYPGGHADGDWNFLRSAVRELTEETGLAADDLKLWHPRGSHPLIPPLVQRIDVQARGNDAVISDAAHVHFDAVFFVSFPRAKWSEVRTDPRESSGFLRTGFRDPAVFATLPMLTANAMRFLMANLVADPKPH